MITCILLSAGYSSRFGSPKALAKIAQKTIIEHLQKILIDSSIDEIIIVLGAHAEEIRPFLLKHKKVGVVYNKDHNFGQTSSFKAGFEAVSPKTRGVFLLPVDYPFIKKETFDALSSYFFKESPLVLVPTYNGRKGHPPIFHPDLKNEISQLSNDIGLNAIVQLHMSQTEFLSVQDEGVVLTFNTREELDKIKDVGHFR